MRRLYAAVAIIFFAVPVAAHEAGRITVTGEGRVDAAPDMATVSLGVVTEAVTAARRWPRIRSSFLQCWSSSRLAGSRIATSRPRVSR